MHTFKYLDVTRAQDFALEHEQLHELVASFEESLTQEMANIHAALAANDAQKVEHALHALKGFTPLFVEENLAQAVTDLYQTSRTQPLDLTGAVFNSLVPKLSALLVEVGRWLRPL